MERFLPVLPRFLREKIGLLSGRERETLEELRLREGFPLSAVTEGREWHPPIWGDSPLTEGDLRRVLETVGGGSVHTILDQLRDGYVTAPGGLRVGICGEGAMQEGKLLAFRRITSLALRFPHSVPGIARPILPKLIEKGMLQSTLILSPPGMGKTTLLRDMIRCLSVGDGIAPLRVGVADERGEIGGGSLRYELGPGADVMEGCPKGKALLMLLRGMNPQVLAADEITAPADWKAMETAAGCGVVLLATVHGRDWSDLNRRPICRAMLEGGIFRRFLLIGMENGKRTYRVTEGEKLL